MSCICNVTLNEIILGAVIAGVIGLMTSIMHTWVTEKRELKKIKLGLKNEMHHTIHLIERRQIMFKSFLDKNVNRNRSKNELDEMRQYLDPKSHYIEMSLVNAIYFHHSVFQLSERQLTIIQNIQAALKYYNEDAQQLSSTTTKTLNEQFDPNNLDNQNIQVLLIIFFTKQMKLNHNIITVLVKLKQQLENPTSLKDFEKFIIFDWQKGSITKEQAENAMSENRGYKVRIKERNGKDPKVVRAD